MCMSQGRPTKCSRLGAELALILPVEKIAKGRKESEAVINLELSGLPCVVEERSGGCFRRNEDGR